MARWLRNRFIAGILVLFPLGVTFVVLRFLFSVFDSILAPSVARFWKPVPGIGLAALVLLVFVVGVIVRSFVGKRIVSLYESLLTRLPVASSVYVGAKQLIEALSEGGTGSFKGVVMVHFPTDTSYAVGFVTVDTSGEVREKLPVPMTNVFVPTTPNPTSGFLIMAPADKLIPLSMSVEQAVKLIVSGGLVAPPAPPKPLPAASEPRMESDRAPITPTGT